MSPQMGESPAVPALKILNHITAHIYEVGIFRAALELGVWEKVAAGEDSAEVLASAHHWHPLATRLMLNDLCSLSLLKQEGIATSWSRRLSTTCSPINPLTWASIFSPLSAGKATANWRRRSALVTDPLDIAPQGST